MLEFIREKSQGWLAWTVVIAICLTFALWGVHSYLYGNAAQDVVAKVKGVKITRKELAIAYNQLKRQEQLRLGANFVPTQKLEKQLKDMALQSIISTTLLNKEAYGDGFRVAPELVEDLLVKMPIFQVNGVFSKERFQQYVNNLLYSVDSFMDQLKSTILVEQLKSGIVGTAFILPNEVAQNVQLINQKRSFNYIIIPIKRFLTNVKLEPNAAKNFYKQNLDGFKLPEKVSIQYLRLSNVDLRKKIKPTEQQIKQFYTNNISTYTQPKKWKLAHLLINIPMQASRQQVKDAKQKLDNVVKQIKQNADFSELINNYSDDASSQGKSTSGEWMVAAQLPASLRAALLNLKNVGDISMPIKIKQGYIILKLLGVEPQKTLSYDSIKDRVLQTYKTQKAEQQFADLRDQLANLTYENPNSLEQASKQLSIPIQSTDLFTKDGAKQGLLSNAKIITAAFSDDVLTQHNNSDVIDLSDNSVIVLRIKKHVAASVKPFDEVKSQITYQLRKLEAKQKVEELGKKLVQLINDGQTTQNVAKKYKLVLQTEKDVVRHDTKINPSVLNAAFAIPRPTDGKQVGDGVVLPSDDYAVISLLKVNGGSVKNLSAAQQQVFKDTNANILGMLEYKLYVDGLMQKAKIKTYDNNNDGEE